MTTISIGGGCRLDGWREIYRDAVRLHPHHGRVVLSAGGVAAVNASSSAPGA